jgi:putative membrane protein
MIGSLVFDVLTMLLNADAPERPWEVIGTIPWVWWPVIALAAGLVLFILVVWGVLHLTPIVLALVGGVLGLRWLINASRHRRPDRALEILRERYATGELSREEFEAKRRDLTEPSA